MSVCVNYTHRDILQTLTPVPHTWSSHTLISLHTHKSFLASDCVTKDEFEECGPGVVHRKRRYIHGDPVV